MQSGKVSLKQIAQIANVDVSTVSRALAGSERVKEVTREEIQKIARELGYKPNELARGLVRGKTQTVGIIVPEISNAFYSGVMMSVEPILSASGYSMILGLSHYKTKLEEYYLDLFTSRMVDGMVMFSAELFAGQQNGRKNENIPIVVVDYRENIDHVDLIASDNMFGVRLAVEHLVSLHHKRIAFVTDDVTTADRLNAFRRFAEEMGVFSEDLVILSDVKYEEGGFLSTMRLLDRELPPTAIFCANDYMALGAMKAIAERGLSVPKDISVVGFDDSNLLNYIGIGLTTVRQHKHQLGAEAAKLLVRRMKDSTTSLKPSHEIILVRPELVLRNSTANCKA